MTQYDSVTKDDFLALKADLLTLEERLSHRIDSSSLEMRQYMDEKTEETRHYFLVVAEQLAHDFRGTHKDKISQHEDRILILEKHVGIKQ